MDLGMLLLEKTYGRWWMMLLEGIGLVAFGGITLFMPGITLNLLLNIFGIYRIAMGVIYLILHFIFERRVGLDGGFSLARGLFDIFFGSMFLLMPGFILSFFMMIVGFFSLIIGTILISVGFKTRGGWKIVLVILGIILSIYGFVAFWNPTGFATVFLIILGILLAILGVFTILRSLNMRKIFKQVRKAEKADQGFSDYTIE